MMNKEATPFFSIVIPTLNEEMHLPNLLSDLANQTFNNFEVIIVDAHSEDRTLESAKKFNGKFNKLSFMTSKKRSVSYQRNLGAKNTSSEWIVFLDADVKIPNYFLQGIKFYVEMKRPDILTCKIDADSKKRNDKAIATFINVYIDIQKKTPQPTLLEAFICVNKSSFTKLKGFDETVPFAEGSKLVTKAVGMGMKYVIAKDLRYFYSLRRVRKQGTLKAIQNVVSAELLRLSNFQISPQLAKNLYPMEGGKYFEIPEKEQGRIKQLFLEILSKTQIQIKNNRRHWISKLFNKFFNHLP